MSIIYKESIVGQIVWLASYPKSGNTWLRAFLTALLGEGDLDINNMQTHGIFSAKKVVEEVLDLDADYLGTEEVECFRREAFHYKSLNAQSPQYIKIHDAYTFDKNKKPLIPTDATRLAIYIIRNPLDVTLSLANHMGKSVASVIDSHIVNANGGFLQSKPQSASQFCQFFGTWSMHVESWVTHPPFPVHVMRYEDMLAQPIITFSEAVKKMGIEVCDEKIQQAIDATQFEKLRQKEQQTGFKEKMLPQSSFFFKGQSGRWKTELTQEQIDIIRACNKPMMQRFGYW